MKATATEAQSVFPPGNPTGVPTPAPTSLTLATGALALGGLSVVYLAAAPFDQQTMQRLFLVAGPITVATGYPGFPPQGLLTRTGGLAVQVASTTAIALQGSLTGLLAYVLGQLGDYAEGRSHRRIRHKIANLVGDGTRWEPGTELSLRQGDTVTIWGKVTDGTLTVDRKRWGPPALEVLAPGLQVKPGDTVIAGTATVRVDDATRLDAIDVDPRALQANGVMSLRSGHHPARMRQQFWYWSTVVAGITLLLTGNVHQALGVLIAGSPSFLDVVGGATAWRESAKWEQQGVLTAHPLGLVAAGEVDTVLFDEPESPTPDRTAELVRVAADLRERNYRVGVLTGAPAAAAEQLAASLGADLWFSGNPEQRARWVADLFRQRLVAVVGSAADSVPAMATAHLAVAGSLDPPLVAAAHITLTGPLEVLPDFVADSRQAGRAEQHGATIAKTLMLAATVAAGVGLLGATSVVTVTSLLGLGLVGLKGLLGAPRKGGASTAHDRLA
ncbi:MAG: hypothetical protein JWN15_1294 [Firmicutes bacterium]|nr:hypothetical protein [Bacillota bacterium]